VARNVGFGLRGQPASAASASPSCWSWWALRHAARQYPHELSGGMQQRVALARAMAPRPSILLLDEPFSSMDAELREQLAREVRDVLKREGVTAILVTHDQLEAFAMADLIGVSAPARCTSGAPASASTTSRRTASSPTSSARACCCRRRCTTRSGSRPSSGASPASTPTAWRPAPRRRC
jgi:ABC-type Fe3+/spermidine/putrescine transport system ATPase subunit